MDKVSLENKHDQQIPWCSSSTKHIYDSQGQGSLICNVTSLLLAYNFCPVKLTKTSLPSDTIFNSLANRKLWFYQAFDYKKKNKNFNMCHPTFRFQQKILPHSKANHYPRFIREIYKRNIASKGHCIYSYLWILWAYEGL